MKARLTMLVGAAAALGAVAMRALRRRLRDEASADPRAGELRERLAEARAVVGEREEFEAAETPVDEVEPAPEEPPEVSVEERRRRIHERARAAADELGGD